MTGGLLLGPGPGRGVCLSETSPAGSTFGLLCALRVDGPAWALRTGFLANSGSTVGALLTLIVAASSTSGRRVGV